MNPIRSEELRVLAAIYRGDRTTRDVAKRTLMNTSAVLRLCYRLEKRGLIERDGSQLVHNGQTAVQAHAWRISKEGRKVCAEKGYTPR